MIENMGKIEGAGAFRRVEVQRVIDHPIDVVWAGLVEAEFVSQWFAPATIEPREGGRFELRFGKTVVSGQVKTFMPPHVFAYTWEQEGESTSLVQYDLLEVGASRTQVTVVQCGLDDFVGVDVAAGWHSALEQLNAHVESGGKVAHDSERMKDLKAAYEALSKKV